MNWIEEEGKTKEEAIDRALRRLGRSLREVRVEILDENKRLLKLLGARGTRIRVYYHAETPELAAAKEIVEKLLKLLHVRADVIGRVEDETIYLDVESDSTGLLIGKQGRTLEALQYIATRMLESTQRQRLRVCLDIEKYQERHAEHIAGLARKLANDVRATGARVTAPPLNPADRRLFHMALRDDPDVTTASEGEGLLRTIVVSARAEH